MSDQVRTSRAAVVSDRLSTWVQDLSPPHCLVHYNCKFYGAHQLLR